MQQTISPHYQTGRGGGRASSAAYRHSLQLCHDFTGLEEDADRYSLLLLVKRVGRLAGFSPRMIALLDYYVAFTSEQDWAIGKRPIVYQSVGKTALDFGVSERQIQNLEQQLFEVGAITWHDSGNHRRYGHRDPETGELLFAFGVDLTPLAYLREQLEAKLHEKELRDAAFLETKRQISWRRRQIRSLLLEMEQGQGASAEATSAYEREYDRISVQIRAHMTLEEVRGLLTQHEDLHRRLEAILAETSAIDSADQSGKNTKKFMQERRKVRSHTNTNHESFTEVNTGSPSPGTCLQESVAKPPERQNDSVENGERGERAEAETQRGQLILATGLHHITLKQTLLTASQRFRGYLPTEPRPMRWNDVVEAAYRLRPQLSISQRSWSEACELLSRNGAAVCLLLTDRAASRSENPVAKPAAYFRGMVNRARAGELRLHNSIFGLSQKEQDHAAEATTVSGSRMPTCG